MDIHQEYWIRHNIKEPFIRRCPYSILYLVDSNKNLFLLESTLTKYVDEPNRRPGYHTVTLSTPRPNALTDGKSQYFAEKESWKKIEWEQWEDSCVQLCKNLSNKYTPIPQKELPCTIWHMMAILCSESICNNISIPNVHVLLKIIDHKEPLEKRLQYAEELKYYAQNNTDKFISDYKNLNTRFFETKLYANWLINFFS